MAPYVLPLIIATTALTSSKAFVPSSTSTVSSWSGISSDSVALSATRGGNDDANQSSNNKLKINDFMAQMGATAALSMALWGAPNAFVSSQQAAGQSNMIPPMVEHVFAANAKEKASGSGSRVNKDADSLLRYGLPIQNKEVSFCVHFIITQKNQNTASHRSM